MTRLTKSRDALWIAMPTIASMREALDKLSAEWGEDQHIEMSPISNMLGSFTVRVVDPTMNKEN
jgi:hypothetical protein